MRGGSMVLLVLLLLWVDTVRSAAGPVLHAVPPPLPSTVPSALGLNTFFYNEGPYASDEELRLLAASGVRYVRNEIVWREIESSEGVYNWQLQDDLVEALARFGMRGMFLFGPDPPQLYNLSGSCPYTDEQRGAFARWAGAAMRRYAGQGHLWEILNEPLSFWRCPAGAPPDRWCACTGAAAPPGCPGCGPGWNTTYCSEVFENITQLHLAVTAVAPQSEYLIGGGVSQAVFDCDHEQTFLEYLLSAKPLLQRWDAVSVHAYRNPSCTEDGTFDPETALAPFARTWARITRLSRKAGRSNTDRPPLALVQSEWGYASNHYDPTHGLVGPVLSTPALQSAELARSFLTALLANVSLSFWYAWKDCTIVPAISPPPAPDALPPAAVGITTARCNYSSVGYSPSPTTWDVMEKPSFLALRTLATTLHGQRCIGRMWPSGKHSSAELDFLVGFAPPTAAKEQEDQTRGNNVSSATSESMPSSLVAWTRRNTTVVIRWRPPAGAAHPCFRVVGVVGEPLPDLCMSPSDGMIDIALTKEPQYIRPQ